MPVAKTESYLSGRGSDGEGIETQCVDPGFGGNRQRLSSKGLDSRAALSYARRRVRGAFLFCASQELRARGPKLVARLLDGWRPIANMKRCAANLRHTKSDAAIDIDGASARESSPRARGWIGQASTLLDRKSPCGSPGRKTFRRIHL